ncbi:hypothetical protein, partial [Lactiplantibacillus pentosus]|uniref:hypothetical protein n=1 Tax=Lactiplantibacillus pentosus TaxID=1589 RepID=UPI001BCC16D3
ESARLANTVSGYADKFVQKFGLNLQSTILIILVFAIPFKLSTMKVSFLNIVYGKDDAIWLKKLLNN